MRKEDKRLVQALEILPPDMQHTVLCEACDAVEEIRLRAGEKIHIKCRCNEYALGEELVSAEQLRQIVSRAARFSIHSCPDSLRRGYLPLAGGHRLGVYGSCLTERDRIASVRDFSSLALRVAHAFVGERPKCTPFSDGEIANTLLVSAPGVGKTTLLREMIRVVSDSGRTVGVADERCEIAALLHGEPQFALGSCTDVLDGLRKKEAVKMLLKTASPYLIAMDEITAEEDLAALDLCACCGVRFFATAHAAGKADLLRRPLYRRLLEKQAVEQVIYLSIENGIRRYTVATEKRRKIC